MTPCGGGGPVSRISINTCLHLANTEHYSALHPHPQRFVKLPSHLQSRRRSGKFLDASYHVSTPPKYPIPPPQPHLHALAAHTYSIDSAHRSDHALLARLHLLAPTPPRTRLPAP